MSSVWDRYPRRHQDVAAELGWTEEQAYIVLNENPYEPSPSGNSVPWPHVERRWVMAVKRVADARPSHGPIHVAETMRSMVRTAGMNVVILEPEMAADDYLETPPCQAYSQAGKRRS